MNALLHHFSYDFKAGIRDRSRLLMFYLFPLVFFFLVGGLMSLLNPGFRQTMIPAMVLFAFMCAALLSLPGALVTAREEGVFRSYRINGVPAGSIISIPVLGTLVHMVIVGIIVTLAGIQVFSGAAPTDAAGFIAGALLSYSAYAGIGVLIGVAAGSPTAAVLIAQILYIPSIILGGLMVPASVLPAALQRIALLLPATHCMAVMTGFGADRRRFRDAVDVRWRARRGDRRQLRARGAVVPVGCEGEPARPQDVLRAPRGGAVCRGGAGGAPVGAPRGSCRPCDSPSVCSTVDSAEATAVSSSLRNARPFQAPERQRKSIAMPRVHSSVAIAIQTPTSPIPSCRPSSQAPKVPTPHMPAIPTITGNRTSPAPFSAGLMIVLKFLAGLVDDRDEKNRGGQRDEVFAGGEYSEDRPLEHVDGQDDDKGHQKPAGSSGTPGRARSSGRPAPDVVSHLDLPRRADGDPGHEHVAQHRDEDPVRGQRLGAHARHHGKDDDLRHVVGEVLPRGRDPDGEQRLVDGPRNPRQLPETGSSISLRRRMMSAYRTQATTWLATVEAATPATPRTGKPNGPNRHSAFPLTVSTSAVMFTNMGSRAWPQARRMLAWPMLNAMKTESPP